MGFVADVTNSEMFCCGIGLLVSYRPTVCLKKLIIKVQNFKIHVNNSEHEVLGRTNSPTFPT
jgi:hypothetical protein